MSVITQGDVQLNTETHEYLHLPTRKKLTSVTSVIKRVYSTKSWDGVDPAIVENARERGIKVEDYVTKYLKDGVIEIHEDERQDVKERVVIAHRILEEQFGDRKNVETQKIVFSIEDGVAGAIDFVFDYVCADLKVTYNEEVDWHLQMGAYLTMGGYTQAAIIHVSPKLYKTNGGMLLPYNVERCKYLWAECLRWWKVTQEMNARKEKTKF